MHPTENRRLPILALAALGVVFGDIGTSPLYAFSQCFSHEFLPSARNVMGILSLIAWALIIVVCVKYVTFMLRADYDGEGGILALLAQVAAAKPGGTVGLTMVTMIALFGGAALYGDGIITPAISVVSAIEGLDVWTSAAHRFIVPLAVAVLFVLFFFQSRGTGKIGRLFGPIMVLWFAAIAVAGIFAIARHPLILRALSPYYAIEFFVRNGGGSIFIFASVVLCVTGAEALYADLAHFGCRPIRLAWYSVVFPALLLNYFGQGANALESPKTLSNAFFALYPHALIVPMVILSTIATVIASQALISGAFSLTHQATQLGFVPRFRIIHTSRHEGGQIYMPAVNVALAIGCIALVVTFRSSAALGGAYGLAVSITMLCTTVAYSALTQKTFRWPLWATVCVVTLFCIYDVPFFIGNITKIASGGWLPLAIAVVLFTIFITWNRGRRRLMKYVFDHSLPLSEFKHLSRPAEVEGTAILFTADGRGIPETLRDWWSKEHIALNKVVLLTISNVSRPYVPVQERTQIEFLTQQLIRVRATYGFMEEANIDDILGSLQKEIPEINPLAVTYYLPAPEIVADTTRQALPKWQRSLYAVMTRNAPSRTDTLRLPIERVMHFGLRVPI